MKIIANGIKLEIDDTGAGEGERAGEGGDRPVVLLIMGLGMQLIAWPPALIQGLVDAGFRVIRFDNRDIGLSQHFDHLGTPNLVWEGLKYRLGLGTRPPYSLQDMANDAIGLLDALQIDKAHVVGVSMGGMIAQRVALIAPGRLHSLTSVMSSSGARGLPTASAKVTRALLSRPANKTLEAEISHAIKLFTVIGSPAFPIEAGDLRARVVASTHRSYHPAGFVRQMVAIVADTRRAKELAKVSVPTLVVHGRADPLVPFACGEDTARRIPGARLAGIDGMGHDLAPGVVERMLPLLVSHVQATHPLPQRLQPDNESDHHPDHEHA